MPLPVIAVLIITKGVTLVGPSREYSEKEFKAFLEEVEKYKDQGSKYLKGIEKYTTQESKSQWERYQPRVDTSMNLFFQLHIILVLLQGCTFDFTEQSEKKIKVNVFSTEEENQIKEIKNSKTTIHATGSNQNVWGKRIRRSYDKNVKCLNKYLDIVEDGLPDDFDFLEWKQDWEETIELDKESIKGRCLTNLLDLINILFSEVDIDKSLVWAKDKNRRERASSEWLNQQLSADGLWKKVDEYYNEYYKDSSNSKLNEGTKGLSTIRDMLEISWWFYNQLCYEDYNRLGQDFKRPIQNFSIAHQESWNDLRLALHGAVAYYIYNLCQYAVAEIKTLVNYSQETDQSNEFKPAPPENETNFLERLKRFLFKGS